MSQEISLQELIDQVKKELLAPTDSPNYPLFFVDRVELELTVDVTRGNSGEVGISVLEVVSGKAGRDSSQQQGHTIRVTLAPILKREEIQALLNKDKRLMQQIGKVSREALIKSDELEGEPE
jgi:hypothetical protein